MDQEIKNMVMENNFKETIIYNKMEITPAKKITQVPHNMI